MALPNGFIDELRTRLTLSDVVGRKVLWDAKKSNQAKGDMWAPCPFHQEKSASFHVDDRKGFYYCFGCHAKGDAISFVRETENVGFMEAVEILAGEAGLQMPAQDPRAKQKADRNSVLAEAMEAAVKWLRLQLKTAAASEARAYLEGRGLSAQTLDRFEIGYAPDQRSAMTQALTGQGIAMKDIIDAGLAAEPDGGGSPYDRFRGRIIYPIRDQRGRCIGLGGRAMSPEARAKYLNSPETSLFDKGRSLYNHGPARTAAGKGQPLIVAEGYMDVIALAEAGFEATVAPLGTAVTEEQLRMLWRMADEPVIALDGDAAGLRAALRVMDLALPLLEAGKSLRFAIMPEGQDPDDLIRAGGAGAMQKHLDEAQPMVKLLWQREIEGKVLDSPERKAGLDKNLREVLTRIADPSIRSHYQAEFKELRYALFRPKRPEQQGQRPFQPAGGNRGPARGGKWAPPPVPSPATKASALAGDAEGTAAYIREAVILATLIVHPALIDEEADTLERLMFEGQGHGEIAHALLRYRGPADSAACRAALEQDIGPYALETLFAPRHVQIAPPVMSVDDLDKARDCLAAEIDRLRVDQGSRNDLAEAMAEIVGVVAPDDEAGQSGPDALTWRLSEAAKARAAANMSAKADSTEFVTAPNGARVEKDEKDEWDALFETLSFSKPGRK
ncbi:DNA primase [Alphaproteobacteria bacterium KMM 3653]|uniref:DNA primase n=1 Tax=Harenicola maris TaxID=2841044 RepID=A0AAP2CSD8_9RHOB|nr:DNA primase [Harenicola maris]